MSVPYKRELKRGTSGSDVVALQRALRAAGFRKVKPSRTFGVGTYLSVQRFQTVHHLGVDGVVGPQTWAALQPYFDAYDGWLVKHTKSLTTTLTVRQRIVKEAWYGYYNRAVIHYAEIRPIPHVWRFPMTTDCSGFATLCYQLAGASDPNGRGYDGAGFTGTMLAHGSWVATPSPGDLCFYYSPVSHVAVYVGGGRVISHGSELGPYLLELHYGFLNECRSYV